MKRGSIWIVAFLLTAALLCGCAAPSPSAKPEPAETAAPTAVPSEAPGGTPAAEPDPTPEPPSTEPDPTSPPEGNGMYDLLCGLFEDYHPGTAGSSLTAAWYAASIVDWEAKNGGDAARAGALAWDRDTTNEFGETLGEKLNVMYSTALALVGPYRAVLEDCGYIEPWEYSAREVRIAYEVLYPALGLDTPVMLLVWYPMENADGFYAAASEVMDLSPATISGLLTDYAGLTPGAVLSAEPEGDVLRAELSESFLQQLRSQGTAGETMLLGSLVNTLLDAYGKDRAVLTVNGAPLETGHEIYDAPLERF